MKGMFCFHASCWCCDNCKSLFACQNADVDFRSFELALTSSDEFLPRSNGAKCACCVSKNNMSGGENMSRQSRERSEDVHSLRVGENQSCEGHVLLPCILLVL